MIIMSTMVPNPAANQFRNHNRDKKEQYLQKPVEDYRDEGKHCAMAAMTFLSLSVPERKDFHDYSANHINHPNDYFIRVYSQLLLETII